MTPLIPPEVESLRPLVEAGILTATEVHLTATVTRLYGRDRLSSDEQIALAVAARGPRLGHVCIDPTRVHLQITDEAGQPVDGSLFPDPDRWTAALNDSVLLTPPHGPPAPLVLDGALLYTHAMHSAELAVAGSLRRLATAGQPAMVSLVGPEVVHGVLNALFGTTDGPDLQRFAAERALDGRLTIVAGGPGTGKTHTLARILAAVAMVADHGGRRHLAGLAAPTGKAAARMSEAVAGAVAALAHQGSVPGPVLDGLGDLRASTIHRLLGPRPDRTFRHGPDNPLPHDLVVIDEASMVDLSLMGSLLSALSPHASLVLVGDPDQLASVEAGTVLADIVGSTGDEGPPPGAPPIGSTPADRVVTLTRVHRFGENVGSLARAVQAGEADTALDLLSGPDDTLCWVDPTDLDALSALEDEVITAAAESVSAAQRGDARAALAAAHRVKVLCATRRGPLGVSGWSDTIAAHAARRCGITPPRHRLWAGLPLMVTANDPANHLVNGDVGIVTAADGRTVFATAGPEGERTFATSRLDRTEPWWAMTIHKSQGSEFDHVVVSLPEAGSPILTKELLYTAITRARGRVSVVGTEAAIRAAIARPVTRASGLRSRLARPDP